MQVFKTSSALKAYIAQQKAEGKTIGFVPTMGALHQGHFSLVSRAISENNLAIVSIFVNPTQFNNPEDLKKYPRNPKQDIKNLQEIGCSAVFLPSVEEMYPKDVKSEIFDLNHLDTYMEGQFRPGHFQGVATIVKRFLEIVEPHRAYFGEKDFQQLLIIKHIVKSLNIPVEIIGHPTKRNESGLALSSRNKLLKPTEQHNALFISKILNWAKNNYKKRSPSELRDYIESLFEKELLQLEYAEISDSETLRPLSQWNEAKHAHLFIAAYVGSVRLIDNVSLF